MSTRPPQPQGSEGGAGAVSFTVLAEIAAGDTARVDLCRIVPPHPRAGALIAVKRLHPHVAEDPVFNKQFLDEVRLTYWLRSPNVVEVAGWGTDAQGSYLAVELVQGVSLLRLMKTIFDTGEAFTERMVVYMAACLCRGLVAAHSARAPDGELLNLVHRDLTPSNVLVGFNGEVKIADFGMAKAKQRLTKTLTGMRKGEPTYMAPEQARSDEIDARADLFSLGVMLFELFAGRRPWIAKSDYEMVQITQREPPADLRELRPKIDRELVHLVNRCLEPDRATRWQSAFEIGSRLDEWLNLHGYQEGNDEALGRFVRRNAMRQMRWFERAIAGDMNPERISRDPPPRVPTYTEHTRPRSEPPPTPPPPAPSPGPGRNLPPRPVAAPDPRSIRAANVVQQLKKLAPPIEPPRARQRRAPLLDEAPDGEPTDVELKIGNRLPKLHLHEGRDSVPGEEDPTLVQKGDDKLQAIRAAARAQRSGPAGGSRPPPPEPAPPDDLITDDDSDDRVTEVKRESHQKALAALIADPDSELPTAPIERRRAPLPSDEAPTPIAPQKAKRTTPVNTGAPVSLPRRSRSDGVPPVRAIPPPPNVPPQPFPFAKGGPGTRPTNPAMRAVVPAAPSSDARSSGAATRVPVISPPEDQSRTSHHDDVEVIDRSAFQPRSSAPSEEALVAEADRLAIESVRRNEEARAAQLRAERKLAAAKMAGDAATIAADAVRLLRQGNLPAAAQRMEEARALETNLQSGKIPASEISGAFLVAGAGFAGPVSSPTGARAPESMPSVPPAALPVASVPPPAPPGASGPIFAGAAAEPAVAPRPSPSFGPPPGAPAVSLPRPALAAPAAADADAAFRANLRPSLLGTPKGALLALALVGVGVVVVLIALLTK